jgi:S1-C subfamily serine protease/tetratricopeptide (TPR) repeat protein
MHPIAVGIWILSLGPVSQAIESGPARATVWIRAGDRSVGTGWVIDLERRLIVTARHVMADREQAEIFFQDNRDGRPILDRDQYLSERADLRKRGRLATGKLLAKNDNADLAILQAERLPADVPALSLSKRQAQIGDACSSIGHRHDSELLWNRTTGVIRQAGQLGEGYFWAGKRIGVGVPLLFLQLPIELGESGAAVLDESSRVIGVVSALANRTPGLTFAIDRSAIQKLLDEAHDKPQAVQTKAEPDEQPVVPMLLRATVWIRPQATEGRAAGVLIDREHWLVLTTASAVGKDDIVDVVAPKWDKNDRLVAEASEYRDLVLLRRMGFCAQGIVLTRDPVRDLALIELDHVVPQLCRMLINWPRPIELASGLKVGERVSAVSHPSGEELMWLCSQGSVRSIGKVALGRDGGDASVKVMASLLQLPQQGSGSGGPVVDEGGKLVGLLSAREGSRQDLAYAASPDEIREFLTANEPLWKPKSPREWLARAKFLVSRGRARLALDSFNCGWDAKDEVADAYLCWLKADVEQCDVPYSRFEGLSMRSPAANALLGEACRVVNDKKFAELCVAAALKADPKLVPALVTRALLGSGKAALVDVESALALDPSCARAYLARATLRDLKDPDYDKKVLADLTRAIELAPYDVAARSCRAEMFLKRKEYKKAAADFGRLAELDPLNFERYFNLVDAQFLAGDRAAAARSYANAACVGYISPEVLLVINEWGKSLRQDNPADIERVADWYNLALREVLPRLEPELRKRLRESCSQAATQTDVKKRVELLEQAIAEAAERKDPSK